mgnify:CR=1 FL=1
MFVRIYKTGYIFHAISILIIALVIWIPSFVIKRDVPINETSLNDIYSFFYSSNYYINLVISCVLILASAITLNIIIVDNDLAPKTSFLGMFFFVLLSSSLNSSIEMNRFLWVSFFMLLMINAIFKLPKSEATIPRVFNASLYLGIASLFYFPIAILIFVVWASLMTFRISNWREYIVAIIGLLLPIFLFFIWYYYYELEEQFYAIILSSFKVEFTFLAMSTLDVVIGIISLGILVPSVFKTSGSMMEKSIAIRQKLSITLWLLVVSLIVFLVFEKFESHEFILLVPLTIILTNVVSNVKKVKWIDLYISLLFILVVVNHYLIFFDAKV